MDLEFRLNPPEGYSGSTSLDVAIRVLGRDSNGRWDIQLNVRAPDAPDHDPCASPAQIEAIHQYFPHIPDTISAKQAHALISYCEYGRAFAEELLADLSGRERYQWQLIVATLVSHDSHASAMVLEWNNQRHRLGSRIVPPQAMSLFDDLLIALKYVEAEMKSKSPDYGFSPQISDQFD